MFDSRLQRSNEMSAKEVTNRVLIYTDGACSGNPGPGGWGAILQCKKGRLEMWGGKIETTNNRMELLAAIQGRAGIRGVARLKEGSAVTVYSDSNCLVNGMISWLARWKLNGWKTATGAPVKNADLWRKLDLAAAQHHVAWQWVAGHSGDECNERA